MFEQAMVVDGAPGKRAWAALLGLGCQTALVGLAVVVPMVWPQALPAIHFGETLAPPLPPAPHRLGGEVKRPAARERTARAMWPLALYQPRRVPDKVYTLTEDEPAEAAGVVGSMGSGNGAGVVGSVWEGLLASAPPMVPAPPVTRRAAPAVKHEEAAIARLVVGGNVKLGEPVYKATPGYPTIARAARVSGDVELECVVGVDGHIKEVKLIRGNPLLVEAAKEAAWRFVYQPSRLNDEPIEIIMRLTFSFRLN